MKIKRELYNGIIIFLGIGVYFLLMNVLGFGHILYLRALNIVFVFYGANRTIKMNLADGKNNAVSNAISAIITGIIGVFISVIGLVIYSYAMGGDAYVKTLSSTFMFGGNPSVPTYSICLLFEGVASSAVVAMLLMLYWNDKFKAD